MEMKYSKNGIGKTGNFVTRGEETSKLLAAYRLNGEAFNTGFILEKHFNPEHRSCKEFLGVKHRNKEKEMDKYYYIKIEQFV